MLRSDGKPAPPGVTPTGRGHDRFLIDGGLVGWFDESQEIEERMSFEEAIEVASRDEGFKASVYAMNTLLIQKGVYTQQEFQVFFVEWIEKELRRKQGLDEPALRSA
jgi:hypothetical protein